MGWQPRRFGAVHIINSSANPRDAAIYRFPGSTEVPFLDPSLQVGTVFDKIKTVAL